MRNMDNKFLIQVLTLDENILRYKVDKYEVKDGMVLFTDPKTGMNKAFPTSRTTIDEVLE
jgi:hypothetical protein